uniref:Vesicle-fusing ATPase n=2 Tax=Chrysotila carterae TaxID=13221 RepID=A0A7S4BJR0_CHRCT
MDGLETSNNGVVVMGATNRVEILDPALTRPGRFDRLVRMDLPDEAGRLAIMRVHTRNFNLDPDVQLARIATASNGLSGAELAALANEAAIRSVRRQGATVNMADFTSALLDFTASRRRGIGSLVSKLVGS